jgi:hypothetical protein
MTKVLNVFGWLFLILAIVAAVPTIGHILTFGLLVIKLVVEVVLILTLVYVALKLIRLQRR